MSDQDVLRTLIFAQLDALRETTKELAHAPTAAGQRAQSTICDDLNALRHAVGTTVAIAECVGGIALDDEQVWQGHELAA